MYITKFWKHVIGHPSHVLVTGALEYSTQATYENFLANAVAGEFGIYNADTRALIPGLGAVGSTVRIFLAVKRANNRDGSLTVHKTPIFTVAELTKKTRTAYQAPANSVRKSSAFPAPVAGTTYELSILDRTPGNEPFPTYTYVVTAAVGETTSSLLDKFLDKIGNASLYENKNADIIVTPTKTDTNTTLTLTAKNPLTKFKVQYRQGLASVTDSQTVAASVGCGYYEHVAAMEAISLIGQGVTTNYPMGGTVPAEYGLPLSPITSANQFNIYEFEFPRKAKTQGAVGYETSQYIIVACNANGAANPEAEIKAIFGL